MSWKSVVCSIAIIFGGCPKRQTGPQVVYVPTPPPAATPSQSDQSIIVQAPQPPSAQQVSPSPTLPVATGSSPSKRPRPRRQEAKAASEEPPAAEVPALQSGISSRHATELQSRVVRMQQEVERRILVLSREWLSASQRGTLDHARGFLQQSQRALQESDLQRAYNLAGKANLLVGALEQSQ